MVKFILLLLSSTCFSQIESEEQNYFIYHKKVNKAEEFFFLRGDIDSSLYYYDEVFSEYHFIFVKDLLNAAQIAMLSDKPYKHYLETGFKYGLKMEHLQYAACFRPYLKKLKNDTNLKAKYEINRKIYLENIDQQILDLSYNIAVADQLDKQKSNYKSQKYLDKLIEIIKKGNFPGDRIIGIADDSVFRELKSDKKDLSERVKTYGKQLSYFGVDEQILSSKMFILILVHNFCSYNQLQNIFTTQIQKGNIHPRDVALVNDNMYRCEHCCETRNVYYKLNMFYNNTNVSTKAINKAREDLYICSVEIDEAKKLFEKRTGAKLFWGFWSCR